MRRSCYHCGRTDSLTADHVPPKGFFPNPKPSNLITVRCCQTCNAAFSKDDEEMRAYLCSFIGASESASWILQNKVIPRLRKNPKFREPFLNSMQEGKLLTVEDGVINVFRYEIDAEQAAGFIIRITKGLLSHFYPGYDFSTDIFRVCHIEPTIEALSKMEKIRDLLKYDWRGNNVFQFRHGITDTKRGGLWLLVFYGAPMFFVGHSHPDLLTTQISIPSE